jgi:hypothetical protein
LTQYEDFVSGELLFWEGEEKHGSDTRIINAESVGDEIHLFYREKLPKLTFVGIPSQARISTGICHISPDCPLTNAEIEQKANDAKRYAKTKGGKNCIVTFKADKYVDAELEVVRPIPE